MRRLRLAENVGMEQASTYNIGMRGCSSGVRLRAATCPRPYHGYKPLYCIECEAGSILLLHVGILPLSRTPCPSFGTAGKCKIGTRGHCLCAAVGRHTLYASRPQPPSWPPPPQRLSARLPPRLPFSPPPPSPAPMHTHTRFAHSLCLLGMCTSTGYLARRASSVRYFDHPDSSKHSQVSPQHRQADQDVDASSALQLLYVIGYNATRHYFGNMPRTLDIVHPKTEQQLMAQQKAGA